MKIAVAGHRPDKLGGYNAKKNFDLIRNHMHQFLETYEKPILISGCALGIDQLWIEAGLDLNLEIIAAIPFIGYNDLWPQKTRNHYEGLLKKCKEIVYVSEPGYEVSKLQKRNIWMIDNSDLLVAYAYEGIKSGTENCICYANSKKHETIIFDLGDII